MAINRSRTWAMIEDGTFQHTEASEINEPTSASDRPSPWPILPTR
jgi:hypothetical protein